MRGTSVDKALKTPKNNTVHMSHTFLRKLQVCLAKNCRNRAGGGFLRLYYERVGKGIHVPRAGISQNRAYTYTSKLLNFCYYLTSSVFIHRPWAILC